MYKFVAGKASILALTAAFVVFAFLLGKSLTSVNAQAAPKVFICKYVGTPGNFETLQTGQNPLSVSSNTLPDGWQIGSDFSDGQGHSVVVAIDNGQDAPSCQTTPPPTDVCSNIAGVQETVPEGDYAQDGACFPKTEVCADDSFANYGGEDGVFDPNTEVANNDLCTNEVIDVCPNLQGAQTTLPDGYHFETINDVRECIKDPTPTPAPTPLNCTGDTHPDAAGVNCVGFSPSGPGPTTNGPTGQVLGASTMAGTGSFTENLFMAIMGLGGTLSTAGFVLLKKASKLA